MGNFWLGKKAYYLSKHYKKAKEKVKLFIADIFPRDSKSFEEGADKENQQIQEKTTQSRRKKEGIFYYTMSNKSDFKSQHSFEKRKAEAQRIRAKYPDRIPVICEKAERSDIPDIDKKKYLVPSDLTFGQFVYVIRKRIKLTPEKAIFIFVNNTLPPTASLMSQIYKEQANEDGFLYVTYSGESTFGSA